MYHVHLQVKALGSPKIDYYVISNILTGGSTLSDAQKLQAGLAASDAFGASVQTIQQAAGWCLTPF